jgi:hypothetical protein
VPPKTPPTEAPKIDGFPIPTSLSLRKSQTPWGQDEKGDSLIAVPIPLKFREKATNPDTTDLSQQKVENTPESELSKSVSFGDDMDYTKVKPYPPADINSQINCEITQVVRIKGHGLTGTGEIKFKDGASYYGHLTGGVLDGEGIYLYPDRSSNYTGYFCRGTREGKGIYIEYRDGQPSMEYKGDWADDKYKGKGILKTGEVNIYGEFEDNHINGYGVLNAKMNHNSKEVIIYKGNWKDSVFNGHGTYYWSDSSEYTGNFVNGYKNGRGVFTWPDGVQYHGEFRRGMRDGHGKIYSNGNTGNVYYYYGNWSYDKFHGNGFLQASNGARYLGEWVNGVREGQGKSWGKFFFLIEN